MCADRLHNPCHLVVPIKGTKSDGTTRGRTGYITPSVWGVTNKWAKSERDHT